MFCSNCGREISDGAAICPYCAAKPDAKSADAPNPFTETREQSNGDRSQQQYQQQYHQQYQPQYQPSPTNGFAIAGFVCAFFFPLLGLIFSCIGLSRSKTMNGEGKGLSIAGLVISLLWFVAIVIIIVVYAVALSAFVDNTLNDPNTYYDTVNMAMAYIGVL